jgi:hypothetical protein
MVHMAPNPAQQLVAPAPRSFEERVAESDPDQLEEVPSKAGIKGGKRQGATTAKKVRVAITDNGVTNMETAAEAVADTRAAGKTSEKPTDDITRLIREKLRNLPVI